MFGLLKKKAAPGETANERAGGADSPDADFTRSAVLQLFAIYGSMSRDLTMIFAEISELGLNNLRYLTIAAISVQVEFFQSLAWRNSKPLIEQFTAVCLSFIILDKPTISLELIGESYYSNFGSFIEFIMPVYHADSPQELRSVNISLAEFIDRNIGVATSRNGEEELASRLAHTLASYRPKIHKALAEAGVPMS